MSILNIDDFITKSYKVYTEEIFPKLIKENESSLEKYKETGSISDIIGTLSANSMRFANYIATAQIKAYHQWLLENYDIVPKK